MTDQTVLVADLGGTNTRVALATGATLRTDTIRRFRNSEMAGIDDVLSRYLTEFGDADVSGACVAMAGLVENGAGVMTNLKWEINNATIGAATGAKTVKVINDLQAQGHALNNLGEGTVNTIQTGDEAPEGASRLVIGVGTGLNSAPVHYVNGASFVAAAESGHLTMPIRSDADLRLATFVEKIHGFPAAEDVISGRGLSHIYDWLSSEAGDNAAKDPATVMGDHAAGTDPRATLAVGHFARILGNIVGDWALAHLPYGGIYLVGGVSNALAPHMAAGGFTQAFAEKGRFHDFMARFPIHVVEDDYAALTGCAKYLSEQS